MLPSKLGRVANRAAAAPSPATACYSCLNQQRSTHQRRHSSSKTSSSSSSADRYSGKANTPAAKATATATEEPAAATQTRNTKGKPRYRRVAAGNQDAKKVTAPSTPPEATDQLAALPRVPSVQSWSETDRSISNFFSLHRPVSINHAFPPPSTPESFGKIFSTSAAASDPWANGNSAERRPEDVIFTLHTAIETLENGANNAQEDGVRWEIVHESPSNATTHHLDGAPRLKSLEEWVAQFKPFRAPPPPLAFPEYEAKSKTKQKKASSTGQRQATKPKQKTFTTTITVTESTYANGTKTYSASSSPIVALAEPEAGNSQPRGDGRLTRRERVRKLRDESSAQVITDPLPFMRIPNGPRGDRVKKLFLISVKRQRKLKMKKHKYKKLMKRTRNLRRRLDRN